MLAMDMNCLFSESSDEFASEAIPEDGVYTTDEEDDNTSDTLGHGLKSGIEMSLGERIRVPKSNELDPNDLANEFGEVQGFGQSTGGGTVPAPTSAEAFMSKQFSSEEEAYQAYKKYAQVRGFGIRKGDVGRVDGVLVRRDFFCNRQGIRAQKHYDRPDRIREERLESRTECKAKLKIYYDILTHVWKVRNIIDDHNHEMAPPLFRNLVPSHRGMSDVDKTQVDSLNKFGIPTSKVMAYMAGQSGGYNMLRFSKRDLYNYVHRQRCARIIDGDAAAAISYLDGKCNGDLVSCAKFTRTADNRLGSLFWTDGLMRSDYQLFGDVLAFDATYKRNKYKKPLVVFSRINHHKQTCIFGFGLLEDEEFVTYRWLLLNLLDVMGNKKPSVVITDGDKAMRAAIAEVFPTATHRLCAWHLEKNCVRQVKEVEFRRVFKKAVYANFEEEEFEDYWKENVESMGLAENNWVNGTYEIRRNWATAYLRGTFCAGYRNFVILMKLIKVRIG